MDFFITYDWNTGEPLDPWEWLFEDDEEEEFGGGLADKNITPYRKISPIDIRKYRQ